MSHPEVIVLPCQGTPVHTVWLPRDGEPAGLMVDVQHRDVPRSVIRTVKAMGLDARVHPVRLFPRLNVSSWICWVAGGKNPPNLVATPVSVVLNHELFGPIIRAVLEVQERQA